MTRADGILDAGGLGDRRLARPAATRAASTARAIPVLLVHGGLRPSGLAPERSLTRFSWTAAPERA